MNKPQCRIERGYDTYVRIYPKEVYTKGAKETHRVVTVLCTYHNNVASKSFTTHNIKDIAELQKVAFDKCFEKVTKQCFLSQSIGC